MAYDFSTFKNRLTEIKERLARDFTAIRTGRATPALLDGVTVESYDARTPLKHLGSITIEDPRTLRVTLWDKTQVKTAENAIVGANLGVSAVADGLTIRVVFPELTAEKRQFFIKLAREKLVAAKVAVRQERDKVWSNLQTKEREGLIREDEKFRLKEELQKLVTAVNDELEDRGRRKETEITQ